MTKVLAAFLLLLALAGPGVPGLQAQTRKPPPKKEDKLPPVGFGFNIGNIRFGNNSFEFGLSPNVVRPLAENLAVGFMLKMQYVNYRYTGTDLHFNGVDFGPTIFARWKPLGLAKDMTPFLRGLFVQAEYEHAFTAFESRDEFNNLIVNDKNRILVEYVGEDYFYVGLGASAGYPFGTFVSIHYNLLDRYDLSRDPWDYRIGFTWNY